MSIFFRQFKPRADDLQKTVTTTAQPVIDYSRKRIGFALYNAGSVTIEISRNPLFTFGQGLPIPVGVGWYWNIYENDDTTNPVYALVSSGTGDLRIEEIFDR